MQCAVALCRLADVRDHWRVKWSTAVGQLRRLAEQCQDLADSPSSLNVLRATQVWAVGEVLGVPRDLDWVRAAVCVDLPAEDVPWMCLPEGAEYWADVTRASKHPVAIWWRSSRAPVWNHRVVRPVLVWEATSGIREESMAALRAGNGGLAGLAPASKEDFVTRMDDELQVSLAELRLRTHEYESEHTTRLGVRGDRLYTAASGYLDVLTAMNACPAPDASTVGIEGQAAPAMKAATT